MLQLPQLAALALDYIRMTHDLSELFGEGVPSTVQCRAVVAATAAALPGALPLRAHVPPVRRLPALAPRMSLRLR